MRAWRGARSFDARPRNRTQRQFPDVEGAFRGVYRAVESPRIDELVSPKGTGVGWKGGFAERAAVGETGDKEALELALGSSGEFVPGGTRSSVSEASPGLAWSTVRRSSRIPRV